MSRTLHTTLSVRGALGMSKRELKRLFRQSDGRYLSADEAREHLMDELAQGHERLPLGEPCEGFDHKSGCPGHERSEAEA